MTPETLVSVIILNYNGREHLERCLSSLQDLEFPKKQLEIIVVDNGSTDDSVRFIKSRFKGIHLIVSKVNLGFSKGANLGASRARGKYLAFLNNDMRVDRKWLKLLVEAAGTGKGVACVGSTILNWNALAKFLPGVSTLVPPLAGMSGVSSGRFLLFDGVGQSIPARHDGGALRGFRPERQWQCLHLYDHGGRYHAAGHHLSG